MNAKCECDAKKVRCDAMRFNKSANANAMRKSFRTTIPGLKNGNGIDTAQINIRD